MPVRLRRRKRKKKRKSGRAKSNTVVKIKEVERRRRRSLSAGSDWSLAPPCDVSEATLSNTTLSSAPPCANSIDAPTFDKNPARFPLVISEASTAAGASRALAPLFKTIRGTDMEEESSFSTSTGVTGAAWLSGKNSETCCEVGRKFPLKAARPANGKDVDAGNDSTVGAADCVVVEGGCGEKGSLSGTLIGRTKRPFTRVNGMYSMDVLWQIWIDKTTFMGKNHARGTARDHNLISKE